MINVKATTTKIAITLFINFNLVSDRRSLPSERQRECQSKRRDILVRNEIRNALLPCAAWKVELEIVEFALFAFDGYLLYVRGFNIPDHLRFDVKISGNVNNRSCVFFVEV
jgi:hypothetical protein